MLFVRTGAIDQAIGILEDVVQEGGESLQPKHESACHYNLGVAYLRNGDELRAVREFNETNSAFPLSLRPIRQRRTGQEARRGQSDRHA